MVRMEHNSEHQICISLSMKNLIFGCQVKEHAANDVPNRSPHLNTECDYLNIKVELMPCGHQMNGRNLIVCIDGTSNQFGERVCGFRKSELLYFIDMLYGKNTNVIELYNLILKELQAN